MKTEIVSGISVRLPHDCKQCDTSLNEDGSNFPSRLNGKRRYFRHLCRICFNLYTTKRRPNRPGFIGCQKRRADKIKSERVNHIRLERFVLEDCKRWDRKYGFSCDLTLDKVRELISTQCQYCDAPPEDRLGLDRIDNKQGHLLTNVVPCCTRCNIVRKDMPYEAWLVLAPGMKEARIAGLFSGWVPGNKRKAPK